MANPHGYVLEPAAQAFCEATSSPPFLYQIPPAEGRAAVEGVQDSVITKTEVDDTWVSIDTLFGAIKVRILKPIGAKGTLPVVFYTHGAGWVFGSAHTHDVLVRDLCVGTGAAVVFPEYTLAPDAQYPVQNEQAYAAAKWVVEHGATEGIDGSHMVISGDSVGGNMAIVLNLMAAERGDGVSFKALAAFYPVTEANFDTPSYLEFATGYFLSRDGMLWFWDQYTTSTEERAQPTASPMKASKAQLASFPPSLIITAECDVLRDGGEQFAARLRDAGVPTTCVRYTGIIHDFVMVNSLHETNASKAAIAQAVAHLKAALA
jgi:acetyl esterase/lipase